MCIGMHQKNSAFINVKGLMKIENKWILISFFLIYLVGFLGLLLLKDFPLPHGDDLFFAGTAIHYASTGEFQNPGVHDYTSFFSEIEKPYWFVTLHPRILGAWLNLREISDIWMRGYVILCIGVTTMFTALLMKNHNRFSIIIWFIPIIIAFGFRWSHRPETTAIPLFIIGYYLIVTKSADKYNYLAYSFIGLSCITSQIIVIPSIMLIIMQLINVRKNKILIRNSLIVLTIAFVQTFIVFLLSIDGEFIEFVTMFFDHVEARSSSVIKNLKLFIFLVGTHGYGFILRLPSFVILCLLVFYILKTHRQLRFGSIALLIGIMLMILIYSKAFDLIIFLTVFTSLQLLNETKSLQNKAQVLLIIFITGLIFLRSGSHFILYNMYCGDVKTEMQINRLPEKTIVIDEYTARYPLNWRLPDKWKIAPDFYTTNDRLLKKPFSEHWIVSLRNLSYFYPELYKQEKLKIGDKSFNNLPINFWEYKIIR